MLYSNEESVKKLVSKNQIKKSRRKSIIKKTIIIVLCFIVLGLSFMCYNYQRNSNLNKDEENTSKIQKVNQVQHSQIVHHDMEDIKKKLRNIPKENPNAQQEITNIYYSDEKVAYLTFDDGPSKNVTPQILDILKQENVPATFFVLGSRVDLYPETLQREYEEGHYIANHGYSHNYSQIYTSRDTVFDEYIKCENSIRNALNNQQYNTYLFRFPGGSSGGKYENVKKDAKDLLHNYGISFTNWNCLTGDAVGNTTVDKLMQSLQETVNGNGSLIVLMHDANDKTYTVDALPSVISYLREQGYTFKNFYEIFK